MTTLRAPGVAAIVVAVSACARAPSEPPPAPAQSEVRSAPVAHHGRGQPMCGLGVGTLTPGAREAILRALADERRAESLYAALDAKLGEAPSPFPRIVRAERRHAAELERVLRAHGETVPTTDVPAPVGLEGGVREACAMGASAERANIAMYDELLARPLPDDVRCVFARLRAASVERHQPAFERCAR